MSPSADLDLAGTRNKSWIPPRKFSNRQEPSLDQLKELTSRTPIGYPLSSAAISKIPIYDLSQYDADNEDTCETLQDEWHHVLHSGPGVYILRNFLPDPTLIDQVNKVFNEIINDERETSKGDHFAAKGHNSRIWNSFQKHAERHPESFVQYYSNPWLVKVCESWLGPMYQVTAQVNIVHPGGMPQSVHRDYHLGFQTDSGSREFPRSMHVASQHLTLQGAVAHSDMPLKSGPTRFLPFSQMFEEGFQAYRLRNFKEYFEENWVSAPLSKGDAVFFNPLLFHAAGKNETTDVERSANLLQISSAFGRTMESIDTVAIVEKTLPFIMAIHERVGLSEEVMAVIKAVADGYAFPTNLDRRLPQETSLTPESEQEFLRRALAHKVSKEQITEQLRNIRQESLP